MLATTPVITSVVLNTEGELLTDGAICVITNPLPQGMLYVT